MQSDQGEPQGRFIDLVRRRWDRLDWLTPIPTDRLIITESHYMDVESLGLAPPERHQLNRLFACFTCELFIHFERYVIEYLERNGDAILAIPATAIRRFVAEEKAHSDAFLKLLCMLRPDLYSATATTTTALRFLRWGFDDDLAVALAPVGSFFLLAWLFEEITLFVPVALDKEPAQCAPIIAEVMRLHAKEEQPHVAIDSRVLVHNNQIDSPLKSAAITAVTLPLLAFVDLKARRAWQQVVALAESELRLTPLQKHRLLHRGPSQSDRMGMASFADKVDRSPIALGSLLAMILRRQLRDAS